MGGSSTEVTLFDVSSGLMRRLASERIIIGGNNIDDVLVDSFAQDFLRFVSLSPARVILPTKPLKHDSPLSFL